MSDRDDQIRLLKDALAGNTTFQALEGLILAERDAIVSRVLGGRLSFEQYLSLTGEVAGLDRWLASPKNPEPLRR